MFIMFVYYLFIFKLFFHLNIVVWTVNWLYQVYIVVWTAEVLSLPCLAGALPVFLSFCNFSRFSHLQKISSVFFMFNASLLINKLFNFALLQEIETFYITFSKQHPLHDMPRDAPHKALQSTSIKTIVCETCPGFLLDSLPSTYHTGGRS